MNIIFNMTGERPRVTMIVASDNHLYAKIINVRPNFTRMYIQEEARASHLPIKFGDVATKVNQRGILYGKTIKQDDMVQEMSLIGDKPPRK